MPNTDLLCSVDGQIGPVAEATISIADEGFLRGDGAFEMLRLYDGAPFALTDHMDRLERSAAGIFLEWDRAAFEREIAALLEANPVPSAALRLVLSRGGRRVAIIEEVPEFRHGLTLSTVAYEPTIVLTGLKTLSYGANMLATRLARQDGADEALLARPDGTLLEAPTSTIFWTDSDGNLHTPALDTGVLASITRQRIMDLVPVRESAEYRMSDIEDAEEVFLASSLREVQGVSVVDGLEFNCPGPVTQRVSALLSERIEAELGDASAVG
jgi:branched-subunit amino acid aminotransferase/4-amino-4-deoxychorismate lyase